MVPIVTAEYIHITFFAGFDQLKMKVAVTVSVALLALAAAVPVMEVENAEVMKKDSLTELEKRGKGSNAITLASSIIPVAYDFLKGE